jgi:hypothetical protein
VFENLEDLANRIDSDDLNVTKGQYSSPEKYWTNRSARHA